MPRKGSRVLDVNGRKFRWSLNSHRARECWDEDEGCAGVVTIQEDCDSPGHVLQQVLQWIGGDAVTPEVIREIIRRALVDGWDPASRKKPDRNINNKKIDVGGFETKLSIIREVMEP